MLTDQELQTLRNLGNEAEAAADEIERLRERIEQASAAFEREQARADAAEILAETERAAERERCAKLCDEARDAVWPYHAPEVLNAACTVCENLANRIRGVGA